MTVVVVAPTTWLVVVATLDVDVGVLMMSELVGIHALSVFIEVDVTDVMEADALPDPVLVAVVEVALEAGAAPVDVDAVEDEAVDDPEGRIPPRREEKIPVRPLEAAVSVAFSEVTETVVVGTAVTPKEVLTRDTPVLELMSLVAVAVELRSPPTIVEFSTAAVATGTDSEPVRRLPREAISPPELERTLAESEIDPVAVEEGALVIVEVASDTVPFERKGTTVTLAKGETLAESETDPVAVEGALVIVEVANDAVPLKSKGTTVTLAEGTTLELVIVEVAIDAIVSLAVDRVAFTVVEDAVAELIALLTVLIPAAVELAPSLVIGIDVIVELATGRDEVMTLGD